MSTRRTPAPEPTEPQGELSAKAVRELEKLSSVVINPEASTLAERLNDVPDSNPGGDTEKTENASFASSKLIALIDRFGGDIGNFADYADEIGLSAAELDPSTFKDKFEVPNSFDEAWNHPDPFQRERWREGIRKEFTKMNQKQVWRKIKRESMEPGRRCVKHKWVFDIKRSGTFRARLVACGYSQVPGQDFNQVFSAVANDVTFRIIIIAMIVFGLSALIFDVETAFLSGELEELIYMDCPEGMEHKDDECLLLLKTIYGLVQSARQYSKKFVSVLTAIGFKQCPADPCLFMRRDDAGICFILTYVDDNLCVGTKEAIQKLIDEIKASELSITIENELTDYLSCEIQLNATKTKGWIGQPHMVKKIIKTFEEEIENLPSYKTPGTPSFGIVSPKDGEMTLEDDLQSRYRTGVGMLSFLIKHSRPDIANAVRELTKVLGKCTPAAYKEMLRICKFVRDTRNKGLKIEPEVLARWILEVYSDSDWAGSKDDRRSVGSFIIFLCGVPIAWRSKSQKVVSLSSSEAEFYACAEAVKEVPFIAQILLFMEIPVQLPVKVWIDNVGAIFMSENVTSSARTRHMDTRYRYVNQLQDEKLIDIGFVRTHENVSDLGTKNVTTEVYDKHEGRLVQDKDRYVDLD